MSAQPSTPVKAGRNPARVTAIVGVSLLCLVGGVALAWWQLTRYESASGTLQNLGYVLQWPMFGVFPAFLFWRILRMDRRQRAKDSESAGDAVGAAEGDSIGETVAQPGEVTGDGTARRVREQQDAGPSGQGRRSRLAYVARTAEDEPSDDKELRMYNRYLSALYEEEHRVG